MVYKPGGTETDYLSLGFKKGHSKTVWSTYFTNPSGLERSPRLRCLTTTWGRNVCLWLGLEVFGEMRSIPENQVLITRKWFAYCPFTVLGQPDQNNSLSRLDKISSKFKKETTPLL